MSRRFKYGGEGEFFRRIVSYPDGKRPTPGSFFKELLPQEFFGGYEIGDAGAVNSVYEGFTLSWADNFVTLDIVSPWTPKARFFPTGGYHNGIRGNLTSLGSAQDTDPLWTGYNDANRGRPVGIDNMSIVGSVLRLHARKSTLQEQSFLTPTDAGYNGGVRPQVSAMIHTAGAIGWYPTTNPVIVDFRAAFSGNNPHGFHPALWFFNAMLRAASGTEIDLECSSTGLFFEIIDHTNGSISDTGSNGSFNYLDGRMRTYTIVMQNAASGGTGPVEFYVNGDLHSTLAHDANVHGVPITAILSAHIVTGNFNGDIYAQADWDASETGGYIDIDFMRVWRKTGVAHWKPLVAVNDLNVDYAGTGSIVLPSAATLWGDASVIEVVQIIPYDDAEPGMATQTTYTTNLPTGVTYDAPSRTLSVDFSAGTDNAGRMHVCVYGYKQDGSTMEPLRFSINRGPKITVSALEPTKDANGNPVVDLYYVADVGRIFPKSYIVTGLPDGWSYDSSTHLLTASTGTDGGSATVEVINGAGQAASKAVNIWSPALFGNNLAYAWDTTSTASAHDDGTGKADYLADLYDNTKRIAQSTASARPVIAINGGPGSDKRFLNYISNGVSLKSNDAAATNAAAITNFANTANAETNNLYAVWACKEASISTVNRVLGWFKADGSQFLAFRYTTTGRGAQIEGAGGTAQTADQASQDTNWHVIELIKNGASLSVTVDGVQVATATITQTGGITSDLFILGGAQSGGAFIGGIGPGILVEGVPSTADRASARQWVGGRMGITTA